MLAVKLFEMDESAGEIVPGLEIYILEPISTIANDLCQYQTTGKKCEEAIRA
jgi:hypothetical protein